MPETFNMKDKEVTRQILVFPISTKDIVSRNLLWSPALVSDDDHIIKVRQEFNQSVIKSNIAFDFTERIIDVEYFSWTDIIS